MTVTSPPAPLRLGLIGGGRHARANLLPSLDLLGVRLTSVATRHAEGANLLARQFGIGASHGDYRRMLEEDQLDAVLISVDPGQHAQLAEDAVKAGVHVFVEKPLGLNAQEARRVADVAEFHQRTVMVGFMKRYAPAYTEVARLIQDRPRFGEPVSFTADFAFAPWTEPLSEEHYLRFGAIHLVDLVRALFGEVETVYGARSTSAVGTGLAFTLKFHSGVVGTLNFAGTAAWRREREALTVTGTRGFVQTEDLSRVQYHHAPVSEPDRPWRALSEETVVRSGVNSPASGIWRDVYQRGFVGELEHFLACVSQGTATPSSARDNVGTTDLCDRLLASLETP